MFGNYLSSGARVNTGSTSVGGYNMPAIILNNYLDGVQIKGEVVKMLGKNQGGFK
jgi:hypothetical protein